MIRLTSFAALAVMATAPLAAQQAQTQPLQRQQFIAQMDAEFAALDGDGNGMVVAEEIVASQRAAAAQQALRQNQAIFAQLDRDGNGTLDASEFAALVNVEAVPVDPAPLMNQFDADRDGVITLVEYRVSTQANFDRIDTDRDGVVTDVELRAAGIVQ